MYGDAKFRQIPPGRSPAKTTNHYTHSYHTCHTDWQTILTKIPLATLRRQRMQTPCQLISHQRYFLSFITWVWNSNFTSLSMFLYGTSFINHLETQPCASFLCMKHFVQRRITAQLGDLRKKKKTADWFKNQIPSSFLQIRGKGVTAQQINCAVKAILSGSPFTDRRCKLAFYFFISHTIRKIWPLNLCLLFCMEIDFGLLY